MDAGACAEVVQLAQKLEARQRQVDDESILPKVELCDVPESLPDLSYSQSNPAGIPITCYGQGTNGLVYQQVIAPLPLLVPSQLQVLPLYTQILTELGLGKADYLEAQHRQSATVGAINAFSSMRGAVDDEQSVSAYLALSSKALLRNTPEQSRLMRDTLRDRALRRNRPHP